MAGRNAGGVLALGVVGWLPVAMSEWAFSDSESVSGGGESSIGSGGSWSWSWATSPCADLL